MQVAANPFAASLPHPHYHSYYQIHAPGPQDHDLKRQYLALLPPQQIIEICLTFDLNAPPYVKSTIWPPDLNAAIAGLKKSNPPQAKEKAAEEPSKDVEAAMDSLKASSIANSSPTDQDTEPSTEPQPPDKEQTTSPGPSTPSIPPAAAPSTPPQPTESTPSVSASTQPAPGTQPSTPATQPVAPAAPAAQPSQPQTQPVQPHYPHQPYAFAHAAYPHTPYYATHPAGYPYPYAPYPAPQNGYHPPPAPTYASQTTMYNNIAAMAPLPQHDGSAADDLPAYEEMIVEALTACDDPEGWAPKNLFAWMASRYPLQSNFRPSASQALQKAFKRGRFEKSSNGKYRLNATWSGGNTSRRTTRRPQTQNSLSTPSSSTLAPPPFTNAPLVHHQHGQTTASSQSTPATNQPTYQALPYGYGNHPGYPGYVAQPQASSSTVAGIVTGESSNASVAASDAAKAAAPSGSDGDVAAAYEAAQNILSAINFGSMYQLAPEEQIDRAKDDQLGQTTSGTGVEELLSHVQAILASAEGNTASQHPVVGPAPMIPLPPPDATTTDPRAELQAQLALLAAQLVELAKVEETAEIAQPPIQVPPVHAPALPLPPPPPAMHALQPPPPAAPTPMSFIHAPNPVPPVPAIADLSNIPDPMPEEEEDSDDDDMEEVI